MEKNKCIRYFADPKNPERVMTVITELVTEEMGKEPTKLRYAYAINHPTEYSMHMYPDTSISLQKTKGDHFVKKQGLKIAAGRLEVAAKILPLTAHPMDVLLEDLKTSKNSIVRRIAANETYYRDMSNKLKALQDATTEAESFQSAV